MAFQIDPSIPLQSLKTTFDPAAILMQAQQAQENQLRLQALRDEYNAAKEERDRKKAMRQGMASELQKMQQGTPAQYRTTFPQTMPTGQMPQGMTGVLASERGQNLPQPALFGENILQGNFDINRELVSPEIAPKKPDLKDYLEIRMKQAFAHDDEKGLFEAAKLLKELEKNPNKYFGGLTKAIDLKTNKPLFLAMTETGVSPVDGYQPYEEPKTPKAVPVMVNGVPKTIKVPNTNDVKILMSDGTLMSGGSIPKPDKNADHPIYFNTTLTGDAFLKTLSPVDQAHVKALNEGREPFPTAKMMASNPYYEYLADALAQYNPDFDATAYNTRKKAAADFSTGIQGRQLLAFGSAVKHLETLGSLVDAMANNDIVQVNRLSNLWQKQTGGVPVNNFEAAKSIVAKEIMKSIVTGGGGVEERQELSHLMDSAKSPEQLRGVINTYRELMNAQKENLLIQRDAAGLPRSTLPDYTKHSADEKPLTQSEDHKLYKKHWQELIDMGDNQGANELTRMYKQKWGVK